MTDAEKLLYDIAYSYLDDSDETVKPDIKICIDSINDYFQKHPFENYQCGKLPYYVIVITRDNCDPEVYGFFQTEEDAEKDAEYIKSKWKEWEWNHSPCVTIEKLMEVKK